MFDLEGESFIAFELVAQGVRWGRSATNGRKTLDPSPIGFVFTIAGDGADSSVAPAFIDIYADWLTLPPTG